METIGDYPSSSVMDFADLVSNYKYFVDKTLLIKDFLDNNQLVMLTRPHGWGKTLNLNMLKRFFEAQLDDDGNLLPENSNRILFQGGCYDIGGNRTKCLKPLKIMQNYPEIVEKHQGKYPVIYLNATELLSRHFYGTTHKIDDKFKTIFHTKFKFLKKYYTENLELKGCDVEMLKRYVERDHIRKDDLGVEYVIQAISAHFNTTIFVFIDEYDEVFRRTIHHYEYYTYMRRLFRKVYDDIFLTTSNLRGMIVGITTAPKVELSQQLRWSYIIEDTLVETSYTDHFGFTEDEVEWLLSTSVIKTDPRDIKFWYKGYSVGGKILYNPNAILGCINSRGQLTHYTTSKHPLNPLEELMFVEIIPKPELSTTHPNLQKPLKTPCYDIKSDYSKPYFPLLMDEWSALIYSNIYITVKDANQATYEGVRNKERSSFYGYFLSQGYFTATQSYESYYNFSIPNYEMRSYIYENFVRMWLKRKVNGEINAWIPYDWELGFSTALSAYQMESLENELNKAIGTLIHSNEDNDHKHIHHSLMTLLVFPLSRYFFINRYYSIEEKRTDFVLTPATTEESKQNAIIMRYTKAKCARTMLSKSKTALNKIYSNSSYQREVKLNTFVKNIYTIGIAFYQNKASVECRMEVNPNYV